jgi:3-hydroxyisobutyrate dehydrogenase-like beta-hydroxyacid dehydrogenase
VSLKSVAGVDSVDVSLEKGLAVVKMKPGNATTLTQLNEAIKKNGFTMKDSTAIIAGTVIVADGKATLRVSGSNEILQLEPQSPSMAGAVPMVGKAVVVDGTIPEGMKGKAPNSIRYQSMVINQ